MEDKNLEYKVIKAAKWATITEFIAKLITPMTNMILARILTPDAFGVIATITMIVSFADMFTDAGFQKYIIQHEFGTEENKLNCTNVAFWTNLTISIILWGIIAIFRDSIAHIVGNPGLGNVIIIACIQLPLTSFSSIQMAVYRRDFDFKSLFWVRIIGISIPFLVTLPLAFLGFNYWSLIIGSICGTLFNAVALTIRSSWKPQLFFKFYILKEMLAFSMWSLIEAISIWLTAWIDTFIIGSVLNSYYLGLYKTSIATVNTVFGIITASTTPVLFSALSRVQNEQDKFDKIFFNMQKIISYFVIPISVGMFIYSDLIVKILLGDKWMEASKIVGIWSITSGIVIVLGHYSSEIYRAKGLPKLSFLAQILHLIVLIPVCIIGSRYSFDVLVYIRAIVRLQIVIIHMIFIKFIIKMSVIRSFKNIFIPVICTGIMFLVSQILLSIGTSILWEIVSVFICIIIYFSSLYCFEESRGELKKILNKVLVNKV